MCISRRDCLRAVDSNLLMYGCKLWIVWWLKVALKLEHLLYVCLLVLTM